MSQDDIGGAKQGSGNLGSKVQTAAGGSIHPDSGPEVTIAIPKVGEILKVESPDSRPLTLVVLPPQQQTGQGAAPAKASKDPNTFPRLLVAGVAAAVVAGMFGLGQKAMDEPTVNARSECAVAIHNVRVVIDDGVRDPVVLESVNPESTDAKCGEETVMAEDILRHR
jgi:hypothetical protein